MENPMYRRLPLILAVTMISLFSCVSLAEAKHTTFKLEVCNKFGYTITTVKSGDWGGTKDIANNDCDLFKHNNTAYYMKTKTYDHKLTIKRNNVKYCVIDIKIENKVNFAGDTRLSKATFKNSNSNRCSLKKNSTGNNHSASITVTVKK